MLTCLGDYLLRLVTRSYNGLEVQLSQMKKSQSVDVRQVPIRHVKMLYVKCRICQEFSRSVVSSFRPVEADTKHIEVVE